MTRINLVPVEELTNQHLFAEFREIKMVPKSLQRTLKSAIKQGETLDKLWERIPKNYTLNKGHVTFFYNKGEYLRKRYEEIKQELSKRGINYNKESSFDPDGVFKYLGESFNNDYTPTPEAFNIIRQRIAEKIAMKPDWYIYPSFRSAK